jgi:hypothetical protein
MQPRGVPLSLLQKPLLSQCHTSNWLDARKAEMLPTDYFHVTITVPQELRALLRANQRDGYAPLMKASADAIIELAHDRRFVGGTVGVLVRLDANLFHFRPQKHKGRGRWRSKESP